MADLLEEIHRKVDEISKTVVRLDTNMETLIGNGQPGIIQKQQDDIENLKSWRDYIIGGTSFFVFLTGLLEYFLHRK